VNQDEVESQLSAMFDGELPTAECELLTRRIDRDENLRARWSRYALIGAAMRFEPVATARSNFAARVSSALECAESTAAAGAGDDGGLGRPVSPAARPTAWRGRQFWWQAALAASLVGAVAGLSITMLRTVTLGTKAPDVASTQVTDAAASNAASALQHQADILAGATPGPRPMGPRSAALQPVGLQSAPAAPPAMSGGRHEPWSYVTPTDEGSVSTPLRTELVDYIVAHSEYSTPLMRPDLLSELISGGDGLDNASSAAGAGNGRLSEAVPPAGAAPGAAGAGEIDATPTAAVASGR
jgi:negative regulator of sigma E activity